MSNKKSILQQAPHIKNVHANSLKMKYHLQPSGLSNNIKDYKQLKDDLFQQNQSSARSYNRMDVYPSAILDEMDYYYPSLFDFSKYESQYRVRKLKELKERHKQNIPRTSQRSKQSQSEQNSPSMTTSRRNISLKGFQFFEINNQDKQYTQKHRTNNNSPNVQVKHHLSLSSVISKNQGILASHYSKQKLQEFPFNKKVDFIQNSTRDVKQDINLLNDQSGTNHSAHDMSSLQRITQSKSSLNGFTPSEVNNNFSARASYTRMSSQLQKQSTFKKSFKGRSPTKTNEQDEFIKKYLNPQLKRVFFSEQTANDKNQNYMQMIEDFKETQENKKKMIVKRGSILSEDNFQEELFKSNESKVEQINNQKPLFELQKTDKGGFQMQQDQRIVVNEYGKEMLNNLYKDSTQKPMLKELQKGMAQALQAKMQKERGLFQNKLLNNADQVSNVPSLDMSGKNTSTEPPGAATPLSPQNDEAQMFSNTQQIDKMFLEEGNKQKFFNQAKDFTNQAYVKDNNENNYNLEFLRNCKEQNIVPLPALAKIQNHQLNLQGYKLNDGLAIALGKTLEKVGKLKENKNQIQELYLDDNGLKDSMFSVILKGLLQQDVIKKINYQNNEFGISSIEPMLELLSRQHPKSLEELTMSSLKTQSHILEKLSSKMAFSPGLKRIRLQGMNLSDAKIVKNIASVIRDNYSLVELDLAWTGLMPIRNIIQYLMIVDLDEIGKELEVNQRIQYLNLSWNTLEENNIHSRQFIDKLVTFIKYNRNLIHLDLNGMCLKSYIDTLAIGISKSISLLSVHLSNNQMSHAIKQKVIKRLRILTPHSEGNQQEIQEAVKKLTQIMKQRTNEDIALEQHPELKLINSHIMNQIKLQKQSIKNRFNNSRSLQSAIEDPFVITRVLGHHELNWNLHYKTQQDIIVKDHSQKWTQSDHGECWVCEKWKYVLIFYKQGSSGMSRISEQKEDEISVINGDVLSQFSQEYFKQQEQRKLQQNVSTSHFEIPPLIGGTFSDWKLMSMQGAHKFSMNLDPNLERGQYEHYIYKEGHQIEAEEIDQVEKLFEEQKINNEERKKRLEHIKAIYEYKQTWRHVAKKYLKYPQDSLIVNYPKEGNLQEEQKIYVYSGYMKPGKQTIVVKDPVNGYFEQSIVVSLRQTEVKIFHFEKKTKNRKQVVRVFRKETSVFKDWKEDNQASLIKMAEYDISCWKVPRFVKSQQDVDDCAQVMTKYYKYVKKVFTCYAALSAFPTITMIDFSNMCNASQMLDKNVTLSTLDRLFIATNVELVEMDDNPDNSLCRFEMVEILVRIVGAKYKEVGLAKTYSEGLEMLLQNIIKPFADQLDWQEFRDKQLWCLDVNDILEANLDGLTKLYKKCSNPKIKAVGCKEIVSMFKGALDMSEKDISFCFGMSKMSVVNELTHAKQYEKLQFVEFLELIGRIAQTKYRSNADSNLDLRQKIELILDQILPLVNSFRKNPDIMEVMDSESEEEAI